MIHISDERQFVSSSLTRELLTLLDSGNILTHVFTIKSGSVLSPNGNIMSELKEAENRGVVLDAAIGKNNFCFAVARRAMRKEYCPQQ